MASSPRTIEQIITRLFKCRLINSKTGCWEWTGARKPNGYGHMGCKIISGHYMPVGVHIVAAVIWLGFDINSNLYICHRCDNPPCFNPEHLFQGTGTDNQIDSVIKGRHRYSKSKSLNNFTGGSKT